MGDKYRNAHECKLVPSSCEICNDVHEIDHVQHNTYDSAMREYYARLQQLCGDTGHTVMPHVPIENKSYESGWLCSNCFELSEMGVNRDQCLENEVTATLKKTDRNMQRMEKSVFWMFLWNQVYNNDARAFRGGGSGGNKTAAAAIAAAGVRASFSPLQIAMANEMMDNFKDIKIALVSIEDSDVTTSDSGIVYKDEMIFENAPPCEWTIQRCKTFQDILTLDCETKRCVSRPIVLPVQHLVLKLPRDFLPGQYSIGLVGCCEELDDTTGMYFTTRDADANHVFTKSVLDHTGMGWSWEKIGRKNPLADPHGFHQLCQGRFLCEDEAEAIDEFGRKTIWIGMPEGRAGSKGKTSHNLLGDLGGTIPVAHADGGYDNERIPPGFIAAIGMQLRTHDDLGVPVYTGDQCCMCLTTPLNLEMCSVGSCNHQALCFTCAEILNSDCSPCPICHAPNKHATLKTSTQL